MNLRYSGLSISYILGSLILIFSASCTRSFEADLNHNIALEPDSAYLNKGNDREFIDNAITFSDQLEFGLAKREIAQIRDKHVRDSLTLSIQKLESFANRYLVYTLDVNGQKKYIYGKYRIKEYRDKGYLDPKSEPTKLDLGRYQNNYKIPDHITAIFNLNTFTNLQEFHLDAKDIGYINFSGMKNLNSLYIEGGAEDMTIDCRGLKNLSSIQLEDAINPNLKVDKEVSVSIDLRNCLIHSIKSLNIKKFNVLAFDETTRFEDPSFLDEVNPDMYILSIPLLPDKYSVVHNGKVYKPMNYSPDLLTKIAKYCPNLFRIDLWGIIPEYYKTLNLSNLHFPKLGILAFYGLRSQSKLKLQRFSDDHIVLDKLVFSAPYCPELYWINMDNISVREFDFSGITTDNNPKFDKLDITGNIHKVILPNNDNPIKNQINSKTLSDVEVPSDAVGNQVLSVSRDAKNLSTSKVNYLIAHLKFFSGSEDYTPPSDFIPSSKTARLIFHNTILDFSGPQWTGFKGLIDIDAGYNGVQYINFGQLKVENFTDPTVLVTANATVLNCPDGIKIKYNK